MFRNLGLLLREKDAEMTLIKVPRPILKSAWNPNRPVSSLLQTQIEHLHHAEKRLPLRYRTEIYINAIKTEGQAAQYVREVTEAIQRAHEEAAHVRHVPKSKRALEIAAVADESPARKRARRTKPAKSSRNKSRRKR